MKVSDRPGVLAQVAAIFGQHGVSIQTMEQWGAGDEAEIYFILHETTTAAIRETLAELSKVDAVQGIGSVIRLVDGR